MRIAEAGCMCKKHDQPKLRSKLLSGMDDDYAQYHMFFYLVLIIYGNGVLICELVMSSLLLSFTKCYLQIFFTTFI